MGGTLYKLRKVKEAHLCFDIAVELSPNEHVAYKIKGNSLKAMKNFDIEIDCYDKSIQLNPSYVEPFLEKADCFALKEMYEKALECCTTVNELFPLNYQAIKCKADLLQKLGKIEEAETYYKK